jgi:hypothetical protein
MGIVLRQNTDANNFLDAAGIARTQANAPIIIGICQLTSDLRQYGLWNKMKAIYPMVGQAGVSSSFQFNLKNPNTFKGTFYGTWTFASTGVRGDASTGYMDTGLNPSLDPLLLNNSSMMQYTRTSGGGSGGTGLDVSGGRFDILDFGNRYFTNLNLQIDTGQGPWLGMSLQSLSSSTVFKGYKNNTNTFTVSGTTTGTYSNQNILINRVGPYGNNYEIAMMTVGYGLTDIDASNLYTAVQRFQTTLGRQV